MLAIFQQLRHIVRIVVFPFRRSKTGYSHPPAQHTRNGQNNIGPAPLLPETALDRKSLDSDRIELRRAGAGLDYSADNDARNTLPSGLSFSRTHRRRKGDYIYVLYSMGYILMLTANYTLNRTIVQVILRRAEAEEIQREGELDRPLANPERLGQRR